MAALLALVSAIGFGISDFSGGLAARRMPAWMVVLVSNGLALGLAVVIAAAVPGTHLRAADLGWGAAAGTVGVVGVLLLYQGLATAPMALVAPLTAVLSAIVPVLAGTALGERPGAVAYLGVAVAMPAIALISRDPRSAADARSGSGRLPRSALLASLGAGVSFGGFYVLLAQTGGDGGAWPLVTQRGASVAILLGAGAVIVARRRPPAPGARGLQLGLLAGVTDFAANLAYLLATHRGLLALVAVISSLYPATTVLLARTVLHERLARTQVAGLGLAAVAVTLIAVR